MTGLNITVYVDVLFLLNLIVDYIIISSTAFISNKKANTFRFFCASSIGAFYSVIIFFPSLKILDIIVLKIFISNIIVLIAFKWKNITSHLKVFVTYYIINFIYGGGMFAFYRFTNLGSKMNYSNGEYYINLPLWAIIMLAIIFYFLIKVFGRILNGTNQTSIIKEIEVNQNGKTVCTNALIDTGNNLYDPISQKPVILVEKDVIKKIINVNLENDYDSIIKNNMRIIPFYDATGNSNIIYAFKPSYVYDKTSKKEIKNVLVGISQHHLSSDRSYQALMHSKHFLEE